MNKMRIVCYDMCNYSFGIQRIFTVIKNTEEEIINKLVENEIITANAKKSIKVIRDKIVENTEYVKIFIDTLLIYHITATNNNDNKHKYIIRAKITDTVMDIKKLLDNETNNEVIITNTNNEILDVNRTLNYYFNSNSHNNILFIITNNINYKEINYKEEKNDNKEKKEIIDNKENKEKKEEKKINNKNKEKKKKEKIPKAVRMKLWRNYNGNSMDGRCECCKVGIDVSNFDCGHIISEHNGGEVHLENLKPICRMCNSSMGRENMDEFMRKYGFI